MPLPKLGKLAPKYDHRTLRFADYLKPSVAIKPPTAAGWDQKDYPWGYMLNDQLGCCTCSGIGHGLQLWTSDTGKAFNPPDAAILKAYEDVGGYRPGFPQTDNGAVMLDVADYFVRTGVAGHKANAFVKVNLRSKVQTELAIYWFGFLYLGVALPARAQSQIGKVWQLPTTGTWLPEDRPGSWGGHAIIATAYNASGLGCITWGARQNMTWNWFNAYADEAYAFVSNDWLDKTGKAPNGLDLAALNADLSALPRAV